MSKTHNFDDSYERGLKGEAFLDDFFRRTYPDFFISGVGREWERKGVDRIFDNGQRKWNVEYKTDYMAQKTGNIYLEMTVNHQPNPKVGWVIGSQADVLIYYIPDVVVYSLVMPLLRSKLPDYVNTLKWKTVNNKHYNSFGMLLPIKQFEKDFQMKVWRF